MPRIIPVLDEKYESRAMLAHGGQMLYWMSSHLLGRECLSEEGLSEEGLVLQSNNRMPQLLMD